jgi:hypothetical protein
MRLHDNDRRAKIDLIQKWKDSGLTQKEFYQQHNIPAHVFYYWHKCYREQQNKVAMASSTSANGFVQLTASSPTTGIELHLPGGIRIIFHEPVPADYIKTLIS